MAFQVGKNKQTNKPWKPWIAKIRTRIKIGWNNKNLLYTCCVPQAEVGQSAKVLCRSIIHCLPTFMIWSLQRYYIPLLTSLSYLLVPLLLCILKNASISYCYILYSLCLFLVYTCPHLFPWFQPSPLVMSSALTTLQSPRFLGASQKLSFGCPEGTSNSSYSKSNLHWHIATAWVTFKTMMLSDRSQS